MNLDNLIAAAHNRKSIAADEWEKKHLLIRIAGNNYWLTTEVPHDVQMILDHLPTEREPEAERRLHQIKTRLSDDELDTLDLLVKASGLPQGEYIRGMILNGQVSVTQTSLVDSAALEELTGLSAEMGRIAGMIRMTVIVNKEFAVLTASDKDQLEKDLRELRKLQTRIQSLAEEIYGHLQA